MNRLFLLALFLCLTFQAQSQQSSTLEKLHDVYSLQDQRSLGDGKLFEYLRDRDPLIARRAAIAFGNIQDTSESVVSQLAAALLDAQPQVAEAIAFSLGQLGPNAMVEASLWTGLAQREEPFVRAQLLESLGKVGGEESLKQLAGEMKITNDPLLDSHLALSIARFGLRRIKNREATTVVAQLAQHAYSDVRTNAAYAFWRIGDAQLLQPYQDSLIALTSDCSADTRMFAVNALARLKENETILNALLKRVRTDSDWRVQVNALRALSNYSVRTREDLYGAMMAKCEDKNEHVSLSALQAIGNSSLKEKKGLTEVWKQCKSKLNAITLNLEGTFTWRQQGEAAVALARLYGETELDVLKELLARENNFRLRAKIIEAIGEIPSPKACEVLIAVSDTNRVIVMACVDALRKVCSSSAVQAEAREQAYQKLISCLRWNDMAVSTTVASALADSAFLRESSVQPLVQAYARLKTPDDVEPMVEILRTLGTIRSPKVIPTLEQALNDKDKTVVIAAAEALKSITGKDFSHRIPQHSVTVHTDYDWKYFDALKKHQVIRIQTNKGSIKIRLFPEDAPFTVMSMLKLIDRKSFSGLSFHRVVPNFVVQGGDPRGNGWGGPGYAIRSEFSLLKYKRGMVGVASAGKDTEGCQFFITHCSTPHLDGRYTIFGEVIEGMEVVDEIQIGDDIVSVEVVADSR